MNSRDLVAWDDDGLVQSLAGVQAESHFGGTVREDLLSDYHVTAPTGGLVYSFQFLTSDHLIKFFFFTFSNFATGIL